MITILRWWHHAGGELVLSQENFWRSQGSGCFITNKFRHWWRRILLSSSPISLRERDSLESQESQMFYFRFTKSLFLPSSAWSRRASKKIRSGDNEQLVAEFLSRHSARIRNLSSDDRRCYERRIISGFNHVRKINFLFCFARSCLQPVLRFEHKFARLFSCSRQYLFIFISVFSSANCAWKAEINFTLVRASHKNTRRLSLQSGSPHVMFDTNW